jgi:cytochrome c oxidase cbb3-type subunit 3
MANAAVNMPKASVDESALIYTADQAIIAKGKEIYAANCASCHKSQGEGDAGPNLTDDYWLHGGDVKAIYHTIKNGVPGKSMIPWEPILGPEKIRDVTFFVMSIQGTNPPGAKAPQGDLYKPGTAAADTTKVEASLR